MRLIKQDIIQRDGSGTATLFPEEPEDMWHAYNLIRAGDLLRASAVRRVTTEGNNGNTTSKRIHTTLTLRVTGTDFDPAASQLHVSGRVAEQNEYAPLGGHHTLDLELRRQFTLEKKDGWDSVAIGMLQEMVNTQARAQVWAIVMAEGQANICYVTEHQTVLHQRITGNIPKKRAQTGEHDKATGKFHAQILEALLRVLDIASPTAVPGDLKPLLIASPGFSAQNFVNYMKSYAQTNTHKPLLALLPKITVAHTSTGHLAALSEVLKSPEVTAKLSNTKFGRDAALLDRMYESIRKDDGKAWYGPKEVEACVDKGAVGRGGGILLITNSLFRAQDVAERNHWVALVDKVKAEGGEIRIVSSSHESGKRLEALGGVAALLTYPVYEIEDEEEEGRADVGEVWAP
ncbi:hypothetical protein EJ06DRAFT_578831 [Trichodelitschia bisporula]|uniref:Protein DOM34 homolog n=1 Tax=Trichodelitschia bisporula TaxID=703511 RepID=A0A6G1I7G6_9PEZI|nr:hypothetical protein EJ06DRAFT_578831 [Trichodelitschia bisporula]